MTRDKSRIIEAPILGRVNLSQSEMLKHCIVGYIWDLESDLSNVVKV